MSGHTCPAPGCKARVPHSQLCCLGHWYALPKPIRDEVWAAYREGQLSERHVKAIDTATNWLASKAAQGKPDDSTCSSCGRPILWVSTPRGKAAPLDAEPNDSGNIVLEKPADPREPILGRWLKVSEPRPEGQPRYLSHFATCPDAQSHRRK